MFNQLTSYIDLAQVTLYIFWVFFFGLIYWLRREDRREGYPLESDSPRRVGLATNVLIPSPKTFLRPDGSSYFAPDFQRDTRPVAAERTANAKGSPLVPTGDPLLSAVGPASYVERSNEPELTREGHIAIVPLRIAEDYSINAGPDPRGFRVIGADGQTAGTIVDVWVDRAEMMVRYLEVELEGDEGAGTRLIPIPVLLVRGPSRTVEVSALEASQFALVPTLESATQVTVLEEEKISAFYAGGYLYAHPKRAESIV
jgi:photosynthetic reaction center H subunit